MCRDQRSRHERKTGQGVRIAAYIGGLLGLALLVTLVVRADITAIFLMLGAVGGQLLWLIPYRALFYFLYANGWLVLLAPYDRPRRVRLGYLFWVTSVRDAIDRLLPVASVGGSIVGVRLMRWRGLDAASVSASVIVEILLTLIASYLFTFVGLFLLSDFGTAGHEYRRLLLAFVLSLPVPIITALLLRYGSVFERMQRLLRPFVRESAMSAAAVSLDRELRACLHRGRALLAVGTLQFGALISSTFEIWFALRLFGHPVSVKSALILESLTQAVRHLAFVIPAGLGVQEASLVIFGHVLGVSSELALAVSMAKRMREVLCGLPSLLSWQWLEGRRLQSLMRSSS
jgi:putative membrane protein